MKTFISFVLLLYFVVGYGNASSGEFSGYYPDTGMRKFVELHDLRSSGSFCGKDGDRYEYKNCTPDNCSGPCGWGDSNGVGQWCESVDHPWGDSVYCICAG